MLERTCLQAKFTRCHSFSGYVPYFLADNAPEACSNGGASPETDSTDVGEDMNVPVLLAEGQFCIVLQGRGPFFQRLAELKNKKPPNRVLTEG